MTDCGKQTRFPQPLEIASRFPHSTQATTTADGKVENQKQVSHFPPHDTLPSENDNRSTFRLANPLQHPTRQPGKIIVPKRKNT